MINARRASGAADLASSFGVKFLLIETAEIAERWPMNAEGVLGGIFMPGDGAANPSDLTQALAKGARMNGTRIFENSPGGRGSDRWRKVIMFARNMARSKPGMSSTAANGLMKLVMERRCSASCKNITTVTEAIPGLPADLPVLRSYCDGTYWKEDTAKLLFGFAHFHAKAWATEGIPETFEFDSLPFVEDDVMEVLELAMERVPVLKSTGIRTFFNGPESYSATGAFSTLGEAPDLKGISFWPWVNFTGIQLHPAPARRWRNGS